MASNEKKEEGVYTILVDLDKDGPVVHPPREDVRKRRSSSEAEAEAAAAAQKARKTNNNEESFSDLSCEWGTCSESSFTNLREFLSHVSDHLTEVEVIRQKDGGGGGGGEGNLFSFACAWRLCDFRSESSKEFIRHLNFHAFHAKVKSRGAEILTGTGVRPCTLSDRQRNIVPDLAEPFKCLWSYCPESETEFEEPQKYFWHVSWHSEEFRRGGGGSCLCLWHGCSSEFKTVSKLKTHLMSHSQERAVACPTCGSLFATKLKFLDHCRRQIPSEEKPYKCSYCHKRFAVERLLRDHMRAHINTYKCPLCEMTMATASNLNSHLAYRHSDYRPFSCDYCEYSAKSAHDLKLHVESVHEGCEFRCDFPECRVTFRSRVSLKYHQADHFLNINIGNYVCHLCSNNKLFKRGPYLTKHLIAVHGLKLPSGHSRFKYKEDEEGNFHLQTERFDFLEVEEDSDPDDDLDPT